MNFNGHIISKKVFRVDIYKTLLNATSYLLMLIRELNWNMMNTACRLYHTEQEETFVNDR